jgi:hypothetical protein
MKTKTIIAEGDGKKEAEQYQVFTDMIKYATNADDITCVRIIKPNGNVLFTRWEMAKRT